MSREDSGVIDLFAMQKRASAEPPSSAVPKDLFSAPPPAFTTDLYSDPGDPSARSAPHDIEDLDDASNPFAKKPRKNVVLFAGAAGALLVFGLIIASVSGGSTDPTKASAASRLEASPTVPTAVAAPPPTVPPVAAAPSASAPASAPAFVPAPPTTGASASGTKAPPRSAPRGGAPAAPAKKRVAGGSNLTKVQSTGVPAR